jgi:hypothetical protein
MERAQQEFLDAARAMHWPVEILRSSLAFLALVCLIQGTGPMRMRFFLGWTMLDYILKRMPGNLAIMVHLMTVHVAMLLFGTLHGDLVVLENLILLGYSFLHALYTLLTFLLIMSVP